MVKKQVDWTDTFREWPASAQAVAEREKCAIRTVQNWAAQNGIRTIGSGNRHQYLFFQADILNFRQRDRPGRRWSRKDG
jgi:hypothetical protein